jgi:hypothetical protein
MNRTLKRPMFRIGGSAGTGITSGLDKPRTNYQVGGGADARFFIGNRMMTQPTSTPQLNRTPIPTSSTRERLLEAIGAQPNNRNLSQFLTTFGLNLLSTPPQGGFFSTVAQAAKQPTDKLFAGMDAERNLQRQVALAAEESDIAQERAIALQLLKNDEVAALPYQRKIQYLMDKLGLNEADAIRFVETSKTDYTKSTEEDKIQAAMSRMASANRSLAEYEVRFEPNIPTEFRGGANKLNQERGKFPKNPIVGKIYYDKGKGKLYEYNGGDANDIDLGYTDVTEQYR